ncbi:hypothetical protein DL96DRAFT_1637864 [Flagelloscypha sp. PMI_526]|nr:hypothetical protein DL96DRAFT_1637864 [Flagelloscypha sp. PMI_526]
MDWFEAEPSLWVAIVVGAGKGFCAGADFITWVLMLNVLYETGDVGVTSEKVQNINF